MKKIEEGNIFNIDVYLTVEEDNVDKKDIDLLKKILNNVSFGSDINKVFNYVRTIFRNYTEKELYIRIRFNDGQIDFKVKNGDIKYYERKEVNAYNKHSYFCFSDAEYKIKYMDQTIDKKCHSKVVSELMESNYKIIDKLENYTPGLVKNEKELISMYNLFYGVYPDFTNYEDEMKAQIMMWILYSKKINLDEFAIGDYTLRYTGIPYSCNLHKMIENIIPYGQTDESIVDEFNNDNQKISDIGKIINSYIETHYDSYDILKKLGTISYIVNKYVPKYYEIGDILMQSDIEEDLVQELDEFLKNMDISLEAENPFETYQELTTPSIVKEKVK